MMGAMPAALANAPTLESAAERLAALLLGGDSGLSDPGNQLLEFETTIEPRPLPLGTVPSEFWAVDGGQAIVADARCLQVVATRAATVRFVRSRCIEEAPGELQVTLLGGEAARLAALQGLGVEGLPADAAVDLNLLRDRGEWAAVERCIESGAPGAFVLVDGDLQPDWRLSRQLVTDLLGRAAAGGITVAGVTKHTALARGGAPLLGQLEREATVRFGARARWWALIGRTRADGGEVQVVAARLDPHARFAFRIDLPASVDPEVALGALATVCDDAGFPGYPYPLTVADKLAAVPGWERNDLRFGLDELLRGAGVPEDVIDRAFADRHRLMERS